MVTANRNFTILSLAVLAWLALSATSVSWAQEGEEEKLDYPAAGDAVMSGNFLVNDSKLFATARETSDPVEKVIEYYVEQFKKADIPFTSHWFSPSLAYVGYFDHEDLTMKVVTAMKISQGRTLIIYSSVNPLELLQKEGSIPQGVPAIEGAEGVVSSEEEVGDKRNISVSFAVADKTVKQVREQIISAASRQGWRARNEKTPTPAADSIFLERGNDFCLVQLQDVNLHDHGNIVMVFYSAVVAKNRTLESKEGEQ